MKLLLIHGRKTPDEQLDAWGPNGPTIEGVKALHVTYGTTYVVHFHTQEEADKAQQLTGWTTFDYAALEMIFVEDLLLANGTYYGDYEVQCCEGTENCEVEANG